MKSKNTQQTEVQNLKAKIGENQCKRLLQQFMSKYKQDIIKNMDAQKIKATIVPDKNQYLQVLGQQIRNGQLVAFPTQTVYGLGADATNQAALLQIYRVKKRPLTDPIIVHVLDIQSALKLVNPESQNQTALFKKLTSKFWPGPLTVILKANLNVLPKVVTAQTGYVGIRSPKSYYARLLIEKSQKPIGAPSANLFSHVSPTSAVHVFNDFYDQEISIVDGVKCQFGVQSTVVKISNGNLEILREGSLSTKKLSEFVQSQFKQKIEIIVKKRVQKQDQKKNMQAPGQLLKHYAPYLPCYSTCAQDFMNLTQNTLNDYTQNRQIALQETVLISFSNQFQKFKNKFKYYLSVQNCSQKQQQANLNEEEEQLFCTIEQKKKMRLLYSLLRKAENLDVKVILIGWNQSKEGTLWDKIFRSTQGQIAILH